MADQIVVLNEGKVQQVGPPQQLYIRPASPFVARFLGQVNILPLKTIQAGSATAVTFPESLTELAPSSDAQIFVRPHDMDVHRVRNGHPCWAARVERLTPLGGAVRLELSIDREHRLQLELSSDPGGDLDFSPGETVYVTPRHMNLYHAEKNTFHAVAFQRPSEASA